MGPIVVCGIQMCTSLCWWWCGLVHMCVVLKKTFFLSFRFQFYNIVFFSFSQSVGRSAGWSCLSSLYQHLTTFFSQLFRYIFDETIPAHDHTCMRRVCEYVNICEICMIIFCYWWKVLTASTYRYCGVVVVHVVRSLYIIFHTWAQRSTPTCQL